MKDKNKTRKSRKKTQKGAGKFVSDPANAGKITRESIGYSLPVDQPLFEPFPYTYKNITILTYTYETDRAAALELLPAQFELPPGPAIARMIFANFEFSSLGFYNEVAQAIVCFYRQPDGTLMTEKTKEDAVPKKFVYPTRFHVTSDRAMAAGREILGIPKKIGVINFRKGAEYLCTLESPAGLPICSAVLVPGTKLPVLFPMPPTSYASIRVIPNYDLDPIKPFNPSIRQLLESGWVLRSGELWSGTGSVHLTGASNLDPYHKLPILNYHPSPANPCPVSLFMGEMSIDTVSLLENF